MSNFNYFSQIINLSKALKEIVFQVSPQKYSKLPCDIPDNFSFSFYMMNYQTKNVFKFLRKDFLNLDSVKFLDFFSVDKNEATIT
jgi:hypothetical protein